jgi:hypothetical protein
LRETIKENCVCGAKFEVSMTGWYSSANIQYAVEKFREAHKICREKNASSQR